MTTRQRPKKSQSRAPKYRMEQSYAHPRQFNIERYDYNLKIWRYLGLIRGDDEAVTLLRRALNQAKARK